jgi:hypothetical protein
MFKRSQKRGVLSKTDSVSNQPTRAAANQSQAPLSRTHVCIGLAIIGAAAVLLFARLGHYALWDDEAHVGLSAIGVWRTGDTSVVIDHNIMAYRNGSQLRNFHLRFIPPLPFYLAAPFIGLMGNESLPARLPFAISGMICVIFIVWWLGKISADPWTWTLLGLAILGNVSLFLYFRQARYYGVAILTSVILVYLYLNWDGRRKSLIIFALISQCLWASNYLNYVAFYSCLAVDYVFWHRRQRSLQWGDWVVLFLPQIVIGLPIVLIWNPLTAAVTKYDAANDVIDKMVLFWWNLRDLTQCEYGVSALLLLAPVLFIFVRDPWLLRGTITLLSYLLVIAFFSPQPVPLTEVADVRYLAPVIPLCIFLAVAVIPVISFKKWWLAVPIALIAFGTNALQLPAWRHPFDRGSFRSTITLYARELLHPPTDPFTEAAKWINAHVQQRQSIWVQPDYMAPPLMYHAPKAIYAWQLSYPPEPQFIGLNPIHFQGIVPPDYVIAFGPIVGEVAKFLRSGQAAGIEYSQIETLDIFWKDLYRPELIWRTFTPITDFDRRSEAIYIFERVRPPLAPTHKTG